MVKINGAIGLFKRITNSGTIKNRIGLSTAVSTSPVFHGKILKETVGSTGDSVVLQNTKSLLNTFLDGSNPEFEKVYKTFDFGEFGREGIPLKYPRSRFIQDIAETLADIPPEEQRNILTKFNLKIGYGDIDGIPNLAAGDCKTVQQRQIKGLIEKFYRQNETVIKDTKAKTYVITNDEEIADIADMAIMIDEKISIYAFYQAAIVMQLLSCEMAFTKGTYQDHVPVLSGRTNTF